MRRIVYGGATSLDMYLARRDDAVDWLRWSDELADVMTESWSRFDTVLMGRRTYEVAARSGQAAGYPGVANYVFSRTLLRAPHEGVELVRSDPAPFVAGLKEQPGRDICLMGGGDLAKSFFEADLIDEVGFNVHPLLLGTGVPAFHALSRQVDLDLTSCRQFSNGCVLLSYTVRHAS